MSRLAPKVSIIIPCYNHGVYLGDALESVAAQAFGNDLEIVIVDDGSTEPDTITLLNTLSRSGTRVIRTANRGVAAARNCGIKAAAGPYILPLDADDLLGDPGILARAVAALDTSSEVGLVYGECHFFGERQGAASLPNFDPRQLLVENLVPSTALYRKSDWLAVGGYNEAMRYGWEDWDFWVALSALDRQVIKLPGTLLNYRVRHSSRDRSLSLPRKLQMYLLMLRRNRKLYLRHAPYVILTLIRIHLLRCRSRRDGCERP